MVEVMVALAILVVGLMANALLMANVYRLTVRSRFMALASQLASEELEDLNRWPVNMVDAPPYIDPHILVPSGSNSCGFAGVTCTGSLTSDYGPETIIVSGNSTAVSYFDYVYLSTQNGTMSETYKKSCTGPPAGTGNYVTVSYSPNGQTPAYPAPCFAAPPDAGMTFDRRWVIEQDQPVPGVRRITVLVTLMDKSIQPPVTFQMSMVRP